jgi:glycosyltransferase involved in cell wall biosynthesis
MVVADTTLMQASQGGAQTFLMDLCAGFVGCNWDVAVVTEPGPNRTPIEALRSVGATVEEGLWRPWALPEDRAGRLSRWIAAVKPDAYVISLSPDAPWLALPLLDPEVVTISVAHNDVPAFYAPLHHYAVFVDCAVGVSLEIHRKIINECSVPSARARHIPYGVRSLAPTELDARLVRRRTPESPLRIGYVGRVEQDQKRVLDLLPLLAWLNERGVPFVIDVVGDGSARDPLARGIGALGLTERTRLWGWLNREAVRDRLAGLDVLVLFSAFEGLPVALLEAMGHGVVPIVTKIASGSPDVVLDAVNGFLVPVGDIAAFGERVSRLSRDRQLQIRMAHAAWETACDYSTERMVEAYQSVIETARHGGPRSPKPPGPHSIMASCRSRYPRWLRILKARLVALGRR